MATVETEVAAPALAYQDGFEHIMDELKRLDILLHLEKCTVTANARAAEQAFAGHKYISDEELDYLLSNPRLDAEQTDIADHLQRLADLDKAIARKIDNTDTQTVFLPLLYVAGLFQLHWLEYQLLLLCLAIEIDQKYEKVYGYLQDNITLKRPSLSLLVSANSFRDIDQNILQGLINHTSSLLKYRLLHVNIDEQSCTGVLRSHFYRLDKDLLLFILYGCAPDRLPVAAATLVSLPQHALADIASQQQYRDRLAAVMSRATMGGVIHLYGAAGSGKQTLVQMLLQGTTQMYVRIEAKVLFAAEDYPQQLHSVIGRAVLHQLPILIVDLDRVGQVEHTQPQQIASLFALLAIHSLVVFSAGEQRILGDAIPDQGFLFQMEVDAPGDAEQGVLWRHYLKHTPGVDRNSAALTSLSGRYSFSPAQIRHAAGLYAMQVGRTFDEALLTRVCNDTSKQIKDDLVTIIKPKYTWDDIVLPDDTLTLLRAICAQSSNRNRVMQEWGFEDKIHYGHGLSVLFSGPPGTGKTMAAHVMANSLGLPCYKIDLSGVVSKYIGETEKNLEKIFNEAKSCNAVLFFDEADALFGKRTDISDAHDRYANIETSYLLQKMEEYNGIAILATNLRSNMDDAFLRRIRFIVDFPFPDAASRKQIWSKLRPPAAPVHASVDYDYLAQQLKVSGANIKNILLNAAYSAASEGGEITLSNIAESARLEYQKIGKSWNDHILENTRV
ncbi:MAG: AAA family ATPase [Gammaproteobacteria bacterium]|nr:AAA family ATPase [Gammaproteobacteria bacterium]